MRIGKLRLKTRSLALLPLSLGILIYIWIPTFDFDQVRRTNQPSDSWLVDRGGEPLESLRTRKERRSLEWIPWAEVSPAFQNLLISTEDRRFYSHFGVDPLAIGKALFDRLAHGSHRGASTITMQVVGLTKKRESSRRGLIEKSSQILSALKLETHWTKEQILETYINLVPFRGELVGLRAASLGYFAKSPSGLTKDESAILAALLRAPNAAPDVVSDRACRILQGESCDHVRSLANEVLSRAYRLPRSREIVPVFSKVFVEGGLGTSLVKTSLDARIQRLAMSVIKEQLRTLESRNVQDAAALVLETKTGRVLAYAANAGAGVASAPQTDGIQMRRQAGSTIKPFVFATAFDWRLLLPGSLLDDSPADITVSQGRVYQPKNYDHIFRGVVSVGDALGSSMNVPAVRALRMVGEPRVLEKLHALGFQSLQDDDFYGPSLALGTVDVSLWDLTHGYRKLAADPGIFSSQTRDWIFDILASPEHRRYTFGMDGLLTLPFPAAVKTGTSKDMRDNWCLGWTEDYTVGVWVGNFNGEPMWNVSGVTGAAPIWRSLMLALHPRSEGRLAKYTPPAEPLKQRRLTKIRYPAQDMLVGLDPDIPREIQKLPIEIENPRDGHQVFVNERLLGRAHDEVLWPIQRGKFRVQLKNPAGQILDEVKFEVR